ncbi:MAG: glycosidase, partial [Firmicutes bacterium]|nr:glycosidase [Bacillota bacterium]
MADEGFNDLESLFHESIKDAVEQTREFKEVDVVIGIPFYNERGILPEVLKVLDQGLTGLQHTCNSLIVFVGDPIGAKMLESIRHLDLKAPHIAFLMRPGSNGRGNSIRAILEIANNLEADAVIFAADLAPEEDSGLQPDWIKRLIEPIREEYDFVVTSFQKHYFEDLLGSLFTAPLLEVFYGNNIKGSLSGVYAISHDTVEDLCANIKFWGDITQEFGIDLWLVSRAMRWNKKICEIELGAKLEEIPLEKLNYIFKENARSLFECIKRDENFWSANRFISKTPDIYRSKDYDVPFKPTYSTRDLTQFRYSYIQYKNLYDNTYYDDLYEGIEDIESIPDKDYRVEGKIWAEIVYHLLLKYWFVSNMCSDDILNALTFAFSGRVASLIDFIQSVEEPLGGIQNVDVYFIISSEVASLKEEQRKDFLRLRKKFVRMWGQKDLEAKPPLIPAHYVEFIPGAPIVLTKKIEGLGSKIVSSEETFNRLQSRYREAFSRFIHEGLGVPETACPETIIQSMREFMSELEKTMEWLLPGNLHTEEGTGRVVDKIFLPFHSPVTFSIKDEVFREMLIQFPPLNVMIPLECKTPRELIKKMDVRTAVSLANLVETRKYGDRSALLWMLDNLRPDSMGEVEIKPIILGKEVLDGTVQLGNISDLNKLTSRIVVRPLNKRMGGDYPKLRFCLFLLRHIMIAQNYDILWRTYARERKNLGSKIRNSLIGRYETIAFSAHNIYENLHHRELVLHFRALSNRLADAGHNKEARLIELMCDGYGLS